MKATQVPVQRLLRSSDWRRQIRANCHVATRLCVCRRESHAHCYKNNKEDDSSVRDLRRHTHSKLGEQRLRTHAAIDGRRRWRADSTQVDALVNDQRELRDAGLQHECIVLRAVNLDDADVDVRLQRVQSARHAVPLGREALAVRAPRRVELDEQVHVRRARQRTRLDECLNSRLVRELDCRCRRDSEPHCRPHKRRPQ